MRDACENCGVFDCPCGCDGDPDNCYCEEEEEVFYDLDFPCNCGFRRNPDPEGRPWGPSLYDPLEDNNHEFKDDSSYRDIASRYRRNPFPYEGDYYE